MVLIRVVWWAKRPSDGRTARTNRVGAEPDSCRPTPSDWRSKMMTFQMVNVHGPGEPRPVPAAGRANPGTDPRRNRARIP